MNLAIIGAGVAGLAAARALQQLCPDIQTTIYEKSRGVGGRSATRRRDGFIFDHGAQFFRAPTPALLRLIREELPSDDLRPVTLPVWTFDAAATITPGDPAQNAEPAWTYADGASRLGKLLAEGLHIRRELRIAGLRPAPDAAWELADGAGVALAAHDAVLLTAPAPQTAEILGASQLPLEAQPALATLGRVIYRRCISLAFAYDRPLERPFYALVNTDRAHPIAWVGLEHAKTPGRCPPGHSLLIAHLAPRFSLEQWETPVDQLAPLVADQLSALLGADLRQPLWCDRQGWRYALPDAAADPAALSAVGGGLFFAGDYTAGQGRIHLAIESGWRAAAQIAAYR